jgi:hypothetical protein
MIRAIAFFEIRKTFRRISTHVYFALFFSLAFLLLITAAGAFPSVDLGLGMGGKVFANSPYTLHAFIVSLSYYGLLVMAAVMGQCAHQDFLHNTFPLFFTTPITKFQYLAGRFIAANVVLLFVFSSIGLGCLAGSCMPFLDSTLVDENRLSAFVQPYLTTVIPNMLFTGALFFGLAALSRKTLPVYACAVILFIGYALAAILAQDMESKYLASVIDPFGNYAMEHVTEYWTVAEKNTLSVPLTGVFLLNRLLWLGAGVTLLGFTYHRFRFVQGGEGARQVRDTAAGEPSAAGVSIPTAAASQPNPLRVLPRLVWLEFRTTARSVAFLLIVLCGIGFVFLSAQMAETMFGTNIYPVTATMVELAGGMFTLFILIVITVYGGQMVWREREAGMDQMCDVLPIPTWLPFMSKLLALILVQVLLLTIVMLTAMFVQVTQGYFHFELGVYLQDLFGIRLIDFSLLCVLVMLVHIVVNHKYLGHMVMVLYYLTTMFMGRFGLEHHLYDYGSHPGYTYSDMNGFGHFLGPIYWFNLYWAAWAVLLAIAGNLLWVRGLEVRPMRRLALGLARFSRPLRAAAAIAICAGALIGGFILYNTTVLNEYRTRFEDEIRNADYEKTYKRYEELAQPRIAGVVVEVDLLPAERTLRARGRYSVINKTSESIPAIFLNLPHEVTVHRLALGAAEQPSEVDDIQDLYTFNLPEPMEPGSSLTLEFDLEYAPRGFKDRGSDTRIVYNGTFAHNGYLPRIGYMTARELTEDSRRRKHGLEPKARMADINDLAARRNTYICQDADWITFEATVSTSPDQIAIAPGSLQREWTDGGRRYFHYKSDGPVVNFFSVLSARYQVRRDKWRDVDIEIYYHEGHEYNLDTMVNAIKRSLEYFSDNFSPYQHRQVRVVEFPRYNRFAQSFPSTIPYSEGIGFIARVDPNDEKDIDYPFYVTAHEVAHQWWAHQVIGGNVQGATMLSEALAQYSALMVMKQEFGADKMKRFLRYELDRYLIGRGMERKKEVPLMLVENQPYIHYNKGSLVMYALQDYIGEANLNRALSDYVQAVGFQEPPYTTSLELLEHIRKATPDDLHYVLEDMFETITLFDNRAVSATYSEEDDGSYEVRIQVASKKLRAGELGEEREIEVNDLIDVGILDEEGEYLYLKKHRIEQNECEIVVPVANLPAKAGIDPLNKLVDRKPADNVVRVERRVAD